MGLRDLGMTPKPQKNASTINKIINQTISASSPTHNYDYSLLILLVGNRLLLCWFFFLMNLVLSKYRSQVDSTLRGQARPHLSTRGCCGWAGLNVNMKFVFDDQFARTNLKHELNLFLESCSYIVCKTAMEHRPSKASSFLVWRRSQMNVPQVCSTSSEINQSR